MATVLIKSIILDEIHEKRKEMTKETSILSPNEEVEYWNKNSNDNLLKDGYKYVKTTEGFEVLQKV